MSPIRLSKNSVFTIMILSSCAAIFLPPRWTDPLKHVMQFLVPAQDLSRYAILSAVRAAGGHSGAEADAGRNGQLTLELASTRALVDQLEGDLIRLRSLRDNLPPGIPLLDAKIVGQDVAAWRDSALVSRGSLRGASWRDWVASRFYVNRGMTSEVETGQAVLARETLLGRIEQVSPYMSRVQLLTDIDSPRIEVRIAAVDDNRVRFFDYACSLRGIGLGKMAIENVESKMIQLSEDAEIDGATGARRIRIGDLIYSAPGQLGLPVPMAVGRIVEATENPRERLVHTLVVTPLVEIGEIREVFIIPIVPVESLRIP